MTLGELEGRICLLEEMVGLDTKLNLNEQFSSLSTKLDTMLNSHYGLQEIIESLATNPLILQSLENSGNAQNTVNLEEKTFILQSGFDNLQASYEHLIKIQAKIGILENAIDILQPFLQIKQKVIEFEEEFFQKIALDQFFLSLLSRSVGLKREIRAWIGENEQKQNK